jgi:hypothetical protein
MVPLLKRAPDAQKVLDTTSRGMAWFVSRSNSEPHAECPLIVNGLAFPARSRNIASVGETMIASIPTTPEVPFSTNSHPAAATQENAESATALCTSFMDNETIHLPPQGLVFNPP